MNKLFPSAEEAQRMICETGLKLLSSGLVAGTWGNISMRTNDGRMAITPSGLAYETLKPGEIPLVSLKTGEYTGPKPSTERPLHREIYLRRQEIGAIIHTHSDYASTVAATRREVPPVLDDMAQLIGPSIRVAEYALPGTSKMVSGAVRALSGRMGALMANHGAICLGRDIPEAYTCAILLEKACKVFVEAEFMGGAKGIGKFEAVLMHQYYLRKYSRQGEK